MSDRSVWQSEQGMGTSRRGSGFESSHGCSPEKNNQFMNYLTNAIQLWTYSTEPNHLCNLRLRIYLPIHWNAWTRPGYRLGSQCRHTVVVDQSVCSRSGCSGQLFRHHWPTSRVDVVTMRWPSQQPGVPCMSVLGSGWSCSTQRVCCRCRQRPSVDGLVTT